jgi:hypothetical protein
MAHAKLRAKSSYSVILRNHTGGVNGRLQEMQLNGGRFLVAYSDAGEGPTIIDCLIRGVVTEHAWRRLSLAV